MLIDALIKAERCLNLQRFGGPSANPQQFGFALDRFIVIGKTTTLHLHRLQPAASRLERLKPLCKRRLRSRPSDIGNKKRATR